MTSLCDNLIEKASSHPTSGTESTGGSLETKSTTLYCKTVCSSQTTKEKASDMLLFMHIKSECALTENAPD